MASFIRPVKSRIHRDQNIVGRLYDKADYVDDAVMRHKSENIDILEDIDTILGDLRRAITATGIGRTKRHTPDFKDLIL